MSLADDVYLVSNVHKTRNKSFFESRVARGGARQEQWRQIKELGVNNRLCDVFESKAHYEEFRQAFPRKISHSDGVIALLEALLEDNEPGRRKRQD
jgi:hypothetical protein